MLSGLMRASVKEVRCAGTTKGCSLNSPPLDQSGPAGIWPGARTISTSEVGVEGFCGIGSSACMWQVMKQQQAEWQTLNECLWMHLWQTWCFWLCDIFCPYLLEILEFTGTTACSTKKQKSMTTVKPWPMFKRGTWFTVSHGVLRLQSPLWLLWFFIHPRPPLHHPQIQLMEAPLSMSTQATTSKGVTPGVNAEWLKTKQNWEIEKSQRDGRHSHQHPEEGEKGEELQCGMKQRKKGRKGALA